MKVKSFLKLVEIQTKVASVIPFLIGVVYTLYRYGEIKPLRMAVFFLAMISIDMATTAINNYVDFKRAHIKSGYNYERHNAIVSDSLPENRVKITIHLLLLIGTMAGLYLYYLTDVIILLIGVIAFFVGVVYSFGPIPISRTPFGELFSGLLMGGMIFFVTVYSQIYDRGLVIVHYIEGRFTLNIEVLALLMILLAALPMVFSIANIMLANNICDLEEDVKNNRFTLAFFLGKKHSLWLFDVNTYMPFVVIIVLALLGALPITVLLVLLTLIPVRKGVMIFHKTQRKDQTFVISVKNFVLINTVYGFGIFIGYVISLFV